MVFNTCFSFQIAEKYGPVFTVHFGLQKAVVLTGYEVVKEALLNTADVFADRPAIPIFYHIQNGNGVFFSSGELWKTTRRFTMATMRDLGMGKKLIEGRILEELHFLIEMIKSFNRKVYAEIDRVLEPGCLPTFEARKNMPFTNAVIHEVQRFVTLLPHVPRCTSVNTNFKGYFIPKGTTVIPLLTSVLLDKTQWETPYQFNPNHFLDADGKFVKKDAFLPFSTGRRNCIGESLAKMELFLFFTGLLQKFTFLPPAGVTESDLDTVAEAGFTMRPRPQSARAVQRQ
uniref:Cytochrome P450 2W1 n=1 Tax=Crocodylus porosus TaxID=8502 RepID=A0A7M4FLI2_CROPO